MAWKSLSCSSLQHHGTTDFSQRHVNPSLHRFPLPVMKNKELASSAVVVSSNQSRSLGASYIRGSSRHFLAASLRRTHNVNLRARLYTNFPKYWTCLFRTRDLWNKHIWYKTLEKYMVLANIVACLVLDDAFDVYLPTIPTKLIMGVGPSLITKHRIE